MAIGAYLDNNATTRPSAGVIEAVRTSLEAAWHNPSSVHRPGQAARYSVELARTSVAELLGVRPREITFTSGGTEALHLAMRGVLSAHKGDSPPTLVTSKVEHAAVRDLAEELEKQGLVRTAWLPLTHDGIINIARAAELVRARPALVVCQWANNETGAVQPVQELHALCAASRTPLLVDAVQWVGKMPMTGEVPGDMLVCSPHKFHGPKGVGVLWVRPGLGVRTPTPGSQELGRRGGTENVPGICGAGVAAAEARVWLAEGLARSALADLRDEFERAVLAGFPGASVNGPTARAFRLWNTTNIAFPRLEAEALLLLLSERGVCASAGAACSSGSLDPSPVLLAMGVAPECAHGSVRFSLSKESTRSEVMGAAEDVVACARQLAQSLPPVA